MPDKFGRAAHQYVFINTKNIMTKFNPEAQEIKLRASKGKNLANKMGFGTAKEAYKLLGVDFLKLLLK